MITFKRLVPFLFVPLLLLPLLLSSAAQAEAPGPGWVVSATNFPTVIAPEGRGTIEIDLFNVGAGDTSGAITVTDRLPAGFTAVEAGALTGTTGESASFKINVWECTGNGGAPGEHLVAGATEVTCTNDPENLPTFYGGGGNPTRGLPALPVVGILVNAPAVQPAEANRVSVSGGGAAREATGSDMIPVGSSAPPFEFTRWDSWFSKANGEIDTQAGSHPYEWTTIFNIPALLNDGALHPAAEFRNIFVELPPGLIANPDAVTQCPRQQFSIEECPNSSMVGVLTVDFAGFAPVGMGVFNIVPPPGGPAELAFNLNGIDTYIEASIRTGSDYGANGIVNNSPQREIVASTLTLWGVPDDPSHERFRSVGGGCDPSSPGSCLTPEPGSEVKPFLTVPTSCEGSQPLSISTNTWGLPVFEAATEVFTHNALGEPVGFTGCGIVPFAPSISSRLTTSTADSPMGLDFDLHFDQRGLQEPEGLAEADLKDSTVSFPAGLAVNPSEANGLQACSEQQVGFKGFKELNPTTEPGVSTPQFTPGAAECPDASKIGTVTVDSPLVGHPLQGAVYLARQGENPFGSLLAIYITVDDPTTGIVVKLPGKVEANPVTGQLTAVVNQDPQLPFEDFKIDLFNGSRAPLTSPSTCGSYTTNSSMTPWSAPEGSPVSPSSAFEVTSQPGGGVCPTSAAQEPDVPAFGAGTFSPIAGTYSPFVLHVGREDGQQTLKALDVTLPEGLLGRLAGVERCPQADIEAAERRSHEGEGRLEEEDPSCPAGSEVGVAHVGAGSGTPFYVTGRAYLAGPYGGAPFSIVVITPAVAGPFDLGAVVVRSALYIDPTTAQVTVKSDPFPTILDGIPLDLRDITVEITRDQFTLNPTSSEQMSVTGTVISAQNQGAGVSSPFRVGGCNNLPFKPTFTAFTNGKASKAGGASLTVRVTSDPEHEANIRKVQVQLPSQLPSRLSTLQKACTEAQFDANPAGCPVASDVATATVHTPLLNALLTGPVYFVSHGGAAFPDLEMVLQGEGVTIVLTGNTNIKGNVTTSKFETVPDAPFTSFELNAPEGPDSILAVNLPTSANYDLCAQKLVMPTVLVGQNGSPLTQDTTVQVTGCSKTVAKKLTRAQLLAKARQQCRNRYKGRKKRYKRETCERQARKKYGPVKKTKKHAKKKK